MVTSRRRPADSRSRARSAPKGKGASSGASSRSKASGAGAPAGSEGVLAHHAADLCAIGLVTIGILLALALYGGAAGLVGTGVDRELGTVLGFTRFLLPLLCCAAGVLIIAGRRRPDPWRAGTGALLGVLAVCGLAELAGGSPKFDSPHSTLSGAGGWIGVGVGRPLQIGIGTAGTVVLLVAVVAVAVILSTGASIATLAHGVAAAGSAVGRGVVHWWAGGRLHRGEVSAPRTGEAPVGAVTPVAVPEPPPDVGEAAPTGEGQVAELETGDGAGDEPEPPPMPAGGAAKPRSGPRPAMGPAAGDWHLPPMSLLKLSKEQHHDLRAVDAAGEALVHALAAHGVETRLVGRTVGPSVTRFELELGPG